MGRGGEAEREGKKARSWRDRRGERNTAERHPHPPPDPPAALLARLPLRPPQRERWRPGTCPPPLPAPRSLTRLPRNGVRGHRRPPARPDLPPPPPGRPARSSERRRWAGALRTQPRSPEDAPRRRPGRRGRKRTPSPATPTGSPRRLCRREGGSRALWRGRRRARERKALALPRPQTKEAPCGRRGSVRPPVPRRRRPCVRLSHRDRAARGGAGRSAPRDRACHSPGRRHLAEGGGGLPPTSAQDGAGGGGRSSRRGALRSPGPGRAAAPSPETPRRGGRAAAADSARPGSSGPPAAAGGADVPPGCHGTGRFGEGIFTSSAREAQRAQAFRVHTVPSLDLDF